MWLQHKNAGRTVLTWTDLVRCRRVMERKPGGGAIATVLEPGERIGSAR